MHYSNNDNCFVRYLKIDTERKAANYSAPYAPMNIWV